MKLIQEKRIEYQRWLKLLKNRGIAVILTIVMIAAAFPFGGYLSLHFLQADANRTFYVKKGNIVSSLENLADRSAKLTIVGRRYLDPKQPVLNKVQVAQTHWKKAETVQEMYSSYQELTEATMELYLILGQQPLEPKEERVRTKWLTALEREESALLQNTYNKKALAFNESIEQLPVRLLARITGITPLQLFDDPEQL